MNNIQAYTPVVWQLSVFGKFLWKLGVICHLQVDFLDLIWFVTLIHKWMNEAIQSLSSKQWLTCIEQYQPSSNQNQFSSVQSLSRVRLFATLWIAARQASLSITNSRSSLRLMSIESVMPSSHLILCYPLLLLPPIPPSLFQWVNTSHEVAKVLEFQL